MTAHGEDLVAMPATEGYASDATGSELDDATNRQGYGVVLDVEGLSVHYGTGPARVCAVDNVSFQVTKGERVALVGESGSGKTSLALAIGGFLPRASAESSFERLEFQGSPLRTNSRSRLPARVAGISMIFQDAMTSLDPVWTVGSQLRAVIRNAEGLSRRAARQRSEYWLERVGIKEVGRVLNCRPYELSGGMRQRSMLALALCSQPKLLIADEPTSALDAILRRNTMDLLLELTHDVGTSLLLISHDIRLCQEYAETMMVMYRSRIVETGSSVSLGATARHPYTIGLFRCVPTLESASLAELPTLESEFFDDGGEMAQ